MKQTKQMVSGIAILLLVIGVTGCSLNLKKTDKIRDLEYTIVKENDIPTELSEQMDSKKEGGFKLTYSDGAYLYIANGYGIQQTSGYSIQMKELYLTENAIYFKSELYGPQNGEQVADIQSYPYIVIKTEALDLPIVFE